MHDFRNNDPDLPRGLGPYTISERDAEHLRELEMVAARLVRAGVFGRGAALTLVRYAHRSANDFVSSRCRLSSVLGALVVGARGGLLVEGEHWAALPKGLLAFHVPTALEVLRRNAGTRLRLGEFTRLVQAGAVYRASWIVDTRRRVTFRRDDRRRALVLREAAITSTSAPEAEPDDYVLRRFERRVPAALSPEALAAPPATERTPP